MKTIYENLFINITKDLRIKQLFWECWFDAKRHSRNFDSFYNNILFLMLFSGLRFNSTIHKELGLTKESRECYRILRNPHYKINKVINQLGIEELKKLLDEYKVRESSWKSRHKIYFIIDETLLRKTTNGFEEIKRLPGKGNENCYVAINLLLVINGKEYHLPLSQTIIPAKLEGVTKIDVAIEMIEKIVSPLKYSGYQLCGITLIGDREYLCDKMNRVCRSNELTFECKMKRNSKLIYPDGIEKQVHEWIEEEKSNNFKKFKQSSQLLNWCRKHKHPDILYKTKIFDTKVLGYVKLVMTIPINEERTEKNIKIYVSTKLNRSGPRIIKNYREIRWIIERPFHSGLKTDLEIEKSYQGTSFIGVQNNYALKCLGYFLLVKWKKANRKSSWSIGQIKRHLEEYIIAVTYKDNNNCIRKYKKQRLKKFSEFGLAN